MAHNPPTDSSRQRSASRGLSTSTVVGAILGVAAGAALTYGALSRDKEPIQSQSESSSRIRPPAITRRATFQDADHRSHHDERTSINGTSLSRRQMDNPRAREVIYADVVDDYEHVWPAPRSLMHDGRSPGPPSSVSRSRPFRQVLNDMNDASDRRSRPPISNHSVQSGGRSRSEGPGKRRPFATDHASHASADLNHHSPTYSVYRPRDTARENDRDSYHSARSHRTSGTTHNTAIDSRPPPVEYEIPHRGRSGRRTSSKVPSSRAGSRLRSETTHRSSKGHQSGSHAPSSGDGWDVPLPLSGVGSSHADWDDDLVSVAPSDSISCVGSKPPRRDRKRY